MMTFTLQLLPDVPAILLTLKYDYVLTRDFPKSYAQVSQMLEEVDQPVYYITDFTQATIDLDLVIQGAEKTSLDQGGTFHHPKVKEVLFVSTDEVIHLAAKGLQSDTYGHVRIKAFRTLDEALAYARAN